MKLNEVVLKLGETHVTNDDVLFRCHGLGSCVGVFLYDISLPNAAGAHIMLPGEHNDERVPETCYSTNAIAQMISQMEMLGSKTVNVRATLVGGANVANIESLPVGTQNVQSIREALALRNITITSMTVGGSDVRSASFSTHKRLLTIKSINKSLNILISTAYA